MKNNYEQHLKEVIIENSSSDTWQDAVKEWQIVDWKEDDSKKSTCLCGKCGLKYLFTIYNKTTQKSLEPIGSSCIEKFGRADLVKQSKEIIELYNLCNAIRGKKFITLTKEYFTVKVLDILYQRGAFQPTKYNNMCGYNDYLFLLKMLGNWREPTEPQQRKINGIIAFSILPFLKSELRLE